MALARASFFGGSAIAGMPLKLKLHKTAAVAAIPHRSEPVITAFIDKISSGHVKKLPNSIFPKIC
jgi:acyl-CoA hydrolase